MLFLIVTSPLSVTTISSPQNVHVCSVQDTPPDVSFTLFAEHSSGAVTPRFRDSPLRVMSNYLYLSVTTISSALIVSFYWRLPGNVEYEFSTNVHDVPYQRVTLLPARVSLSLLCATMPNDNVIRARWVKLH